MKLYVWNEPYSVSYGQTMVFAVAETLEDAKREARNGEGYSYGDCPDGAPFNLELGEPTRVVDLPCAEWHKWSE